MKNSPACNVLPPSFFDGPCVSVAQSLIGKYLVCKKGDQIIELMINEVEAYDGPHDQASHGRFGKTQRTAPMFGPPGHFYMYFVYGMYWMLNIVTGPKNYPAAILIRGAGHISGPGRLTKFLDIDKKHNTLPAQPTTGLWFEDRGAIIAPEQIIATPRIGIDYAGPEWSAKPYRFVLK